MKKTNFGSRAERDQYIDVILCEPGKKAHVISIANRLESLQEIVGGFIEVVYPFDDPVAIICNEEGKLNGMEVNRALRNPTAKTYDILVGPFLVIGLSKNNFTSLPIELQKKYFTMFEHPNIRI